MNDTNRHTVVFCFVTQEKQSICSCLVNKMQDNAVSKSVQNETGRAASSVYGGSCLQADLEVL